MKTLRCRSASLILPLMVLLCGPLRVHADFDLFKSKQKAKAAATAARLKEIDQSIGGFADRYVTYLSEACDQAAKDNPNPEAAKQALRLKLHTSTAAYDIVTGPNPLGELLDLCGIVTLEEMNWVEEGNAKKIFGADHSEPVEKAFSSAYNEVWSIAARFLTPEEILETKAVIREWRKEHRDITLLSYVRFDDFARARAGLDQEAPAVRGLFSEITEANRSIQTAQQFGERTFYYAQRVPRLLQWQTERTVQAVMENPDLQRSLSVVEHVSDTIAAGTKQFDERQQEIQRLLDQVNEIAIRGKELAVEAHQTSTSLTETLKAADQLAQTLNPPPAPGGPPGKPFDIEEYGRVIEKTTAAAHEARLITENALQIEASSAFNHRIADVEAFTQRRTDHITVRVAELIVFFFVLLLLTRWISAKWLTHKDPKDR